MNRINFYTIGAKEIYKELSNISSRGKSIRDIFDDFLTMCICAISGGQMEEKYHKAISKYEKEEVGFFPKAFAILINSMEDEKKDILGDFFEGAVSFGEHGQFFTPDHICDIMAEIGGRSENFTSVADPTCGSGLTDEKWLVYETGFNGKGFIREVEVKEEKQIEKIIETKIEEKHKELVQVGFSF